MALQLQAPAAAAEVEGSVSSTHMVANSSFRGLMSSSGPLGCTLCTAVHAGKTPLPMKSNFFLKKY